MPFDFQFRTLQKTKELKQLVDFLILQHLNYPKYEEWVQRAEQEILTSYKTPILAYSDYTLVGNLIYQKHKSEPRIREIKNIRVHPDVRRRDFAHFMLRQAEANDSQEYDAIICDARANQKSIINLLLFSGYVPIGKANLYDSHKEDIVFIKTFDKKTTGDLISRAKELLF